MAIDAVNVRALKNNPSQALEKATRGPVIVLKGDTPAAILISMDALGGSDDLRPALARALYEAGVVSLGRAARIAGMHYGDFINLLGNWGVPVIRYSDDDLLGELEMVKQW